MAGCTSKRRMGRRSPTRCYPSCTRSALTTLRHSGTARRRWISTPRRIPGRRQSSEAAKEQNMLLNSFMRRLVAGVLGALCVAGWLHAAAVAPLADAARDGDREVARALLKQAADVNSAHP